jgi:hypothetical protein
MFNLRIRHLAVLLLILILAASAYAFAADNSVEASKAGDGSEAISGYGITNINYELVSVDADPTDIDEVKFTIDTAPGANGEVFIQLNSVAGTWFPCDVSGGTAIVCDTSGSSVPLGTTLTNLRVIAAQ